MTEDEAIAQLDAIPTGLNDGERMHQECERIVRAFLRAAHPDLADAVQAVEDDAPYWVFS